MKREDIQTLIGRPISDTEWTEACGLLAFIESHPDADAVLDRCAELGLSAEATIGELSKLPPAEVATAREGDHSEQAT
jgi:hypothetical protein